MSRRTGLLASAFRLGLAASVAASLGAAASAGAREISFPIRLAHPFIRQLVADTLFTGDGESMRAWQDANRCNDVVLSKPRITGDDDKIHLIADFHARLGAAVGSWCLNVTDWEGGIDAVLEPRLHPSLPIVEFRVVDSHLYAKDGSKTFTGTLWDWVKSQVHPRLEAIRIDLYRPITELKSFLPVLFPRADLERTRRLLDSIMLTAVEASEQELTVHVQLQVPEPAAFAIPLPEPTLTIEELERWERAWQSWDAFLTFLVKRSGSDANAAARERLREVFLEARYDIVEILRPTEPRTSDPVRPLFLKTWVRLAPILREMTTNLPGETGLRYMSFVTAADALAALEQLGPEYGVDLSADGMRRLARIIEPAPLVDPTAYSDEVDPELRALFGFGPPPPTPEVEDAVEAEETPPAESQEERAPERESSSGMPRSMPAETAAAHVRVGRAEGGEVSRLALWSMETIADFLIRVCSAPAEARAVRRKLERWIPAREEVGDYLAQVRDLLLRTQDATQRDKPVGERYSLLFRHMMLATAWQESCWRQFVKKGGAVQPLTSPVGAVGIMQVNVRVWRGFYDQKALRESMAYNATAGSEILRHYLVDHAIRKGEHEARGNIDDLARATYAAYNGGPGKLQRYRQQTGGKTGHRIDQAFWTKYQRIKAGNDLAVASCFGVTVES